MKMQTLLLIFLLATLCGGDKRLYLFDLYACVDEYEDYCHQIPQWTVRAATELANDRDDILPGYTLSTLNRSSDCCPNRLRDCCLNSSVLLDGEVCVALINVKPLPQLGQGGRVRI